MPLWGEHPPLTLLAYRSYDKNNWQETQESLELQKGLDEDFVLLEGYYEFPTHRYLVS